MVPKSESNRAKIGLKSVCVRSQQQSGRWIPKKHGPPRFFSHILGPSGQFEAPLWAHLAPNGGLRRPKWRPDSTKKRCQKSMRKRCRKTMEKEANPPTLGVAKQTELLGGGLPPPYPPPLGHPSPKRPNKVKWWKK